MEVTFHRGIEGADPVRPQPVGFPAETQEDRRVAASRRLGVGTLACPVCDAPVSLADARVAPSDALACPFCDHGAPTREFLSMTAPSRPTRVEVRIVQRARRFAR